MEEVSHGNHHLPSGLLRLDPEEAVTILGTAVYVTKCTVVRHILGNEADLVHRVVVQAILQTVNIKFLYFLFSVQKEFVSNFSLESKETKILKGECISHPCLFIPYLEAVNSNLNIDLERGKETMIGTVLWNHTFCLCSPDALMAIFSS